jgi:hypothetical protein
MPPLAALTQRLRSLDRLLNEAGCARQAAVSHARSQTMTTIQIELPDATAQAARAAGLLTPQALDRLLTDALKRQEAADSLLPIADRVAAAGIEPMSMDEISAEVKAARVERRPR